MVEPTVPALGALEIPVPVGKGPIREEEPPVGLVPKMDEALPGTGYGVKPVELTPVPLLGLPVPVDNPLAGLLPMMDDALLGVGYGGKPA